MSNLPEIPSAKIEQKLLSKFVDQLTQTVHLEALAEALRDERDNARTERDFLKRQLDELRGQSNTSVDTPDGN